MANHIPVLEESREGRQGGPDLRGLILAEEMAAAGYIQLARCFRGREVTVLKRLARESQAHAICMKGIWTLITGEAPEVKAPAPEPGPVMVMLRKSYGKAMRTLVDYEARSQDSEYGPVFARLAARKRDHCRTILELIGGMGK